MTYLNQKYLKKDGCNLDPEVVFFGIKGVINYKDSDYETILQQVKE